MIGPFESVIIMLRPGSKRMDWKCNPRGGNW